CCVSLSMMCFFSSIIRLPPRSTLFPYTTALPIFAEGNHHPAPVHPRMRDASPAQAPARRRGGGRCGERFRRRLTTCTAGLLSVDEPLPPARVSRAVSEATPPRLS